MGSGFDEEFDDVGVRGAMLAAKQPGFAKLLAFIRKGDTLHVYAVDRLGAGCSRCLVHCPVFARQGGSRSRSGPGRDGQGCQ